MERKILLFVGPDEASNRSAEEILERIEGADVTLVVSGSTVLDGRVLLPFIETGEGSRYYGVNSIHDFVEEQTSGTT